jgi:adenine-specific DNA-methyltransferase
LSDPTKDDPGNLVIEGDNRKALVSLALLRGGVDVVLIDPPYNTGKNDLRYSDRRFHDPEADEVGAKFVTNLDGGRHTKWVNEMAPTLVLIKDLMMPNGVIFVHINDIELPRLLMLMEEIFTEGNHLGTIIWKGATDNNPSQIVVEHEYIVCYAKDRRRVPSPWKGQMNDLVELMAAEFSRLKAENPDLKALTKRWKAWIRSHRDELPNALRRKTEVDSRRGPVEKKLTEIFASVLGVERVGVHDDFFLLGGHSLMVAVLLARVHEAFGVELPIRSLFDAPTVETFAADLAKRVGVVGMSSGQRR